MRSRPMLTFILSMGLLLLGASGCPAAVGENVKTAEPAIAAGATNFNYGEALQKAIFFYEAQRSGKLPDKMRLNWRGDSGLQDGADNGVDLTGGWYDAGDHVKFNLPMAYTVTMLGWAAYENREALAASGQLDYLLENIKWASDYLIKCHTGPNEFYYQVGEGSSDHQWWGPAEVMPMERPSFKLTTKMPGSCVVGEAAAALAVTALIFRESDPAYAATCLQHARELYSFADNTKSDAGYIMADGFYKSWSGFYDELSWAGAWLYLATKEEKYLQKAEAYVANWQRDTDQKTIYYKWAQCWDDVHYGAAFLLAKITGKAQYKQVLEDHLDWWTVGCRGEQIKYYDRLAWMTQWGSLRYATTTAFLAALYSEWSGCSPEKATVYRNFAKSQVDYALGANPFNRSFVVGFGQNPPQHPHHRTAQGSWCNNMDIPQEHRHTLYGALVGGPGLEGVYTDTTRNYVCNEVACDYNAGFVGALSMLYRWYGGQPLPDFKAFEPIGEEQFFVEAMLRTGGPNFTEITTLVNNRSGWPARLTDRLSFRCYLDLAEFLKSGGKPEQLKVTPKVNNDVKVKVSAPRKHQGSVYYVAVDLSGTPIYPGGSYNSCKEVTLRFTVPAKYQWSAKNDFSFQGLKADEAQKTQFIPLYDQGQLIYGKEPALAE